MEKAVVKAMEGFAIGAVNEAFERIASVVKDQVSLVLKLDDEIVVLRRILPKVKELVLNAEAQIFLCFGDSEPDTRDFLKGLKGFVYDAEDILDEFDTEVARRPLNISIIGAAEQQQNRVARWLIVWARVVMGEQGFKSLRIFLRPVCSCFPAFSSCFDGELPLFTCIKIANQIKGLYAELEGIKDLKQRSERFLSDLSNELQISGDEATKNSSRLPPRKTDMSLMRRKDFQMVGRGGEKERLVEDLLLASKSKPPVLLITGMGGIGKTTLAYVILQDPAIVKHFNFTKWVDVGDMELDPKKVLDKISGKRTNDLEEAREKAQSSVKDKTFLIVLDDVWKGNELKSRWNELWIPLTYGDTGSRVIVTTRQVDVATNMEGVAVQVEELDRLADEDCLEIFQTFAFPGDHEAPSSSSPSYFQKVIGERIVREKIKGVPLAARVVGSSLRDKNKSYWRAALHQIKEKDINSALMWSYRCLPTHLKQCFSYFSLLPKDSSLDKREIVLMWIAQCYVIHSDIHFTLEDVGEEYFDDLVRASLIQVVGDAYKMHDLIHDFATEVSGGVCFYKGKEMDETESYEVREPQALRHLVLDRGVKLPQNHSNIKKLWTFKSHYPAHVDSLSDQLRTVRVLILNKGITTYEANFPNMMHLRYLDLSRLRIRALPESLCSLYHLQVLALSTAVTEFPEGMWKLINLRHLHGGRHISRIASIGELTSLQTISEFYSSGNEGENIGQLKNLNQLRGSLTICDLKNVQSSQFAHDAQLHNKTHLEELVLNDVDVDFWSCVDNEGEISPETEKLLELKREVFGGLRPHEGLKVLEIKNYGGKELPIWMERHNILNIVSLTLGNCDYLKKLPPLGHLHRLEYLKIAYCSSIKQIGCEGQAFPSLKELVLMEMPKLEKWEGLDVPREEDWINYFPLLRRLYVKHCKNLRCLPNAPGCLEDLDIDSTALTLLPRVWGCCRDAAGDVSKHNCSLRSLTSLSLIKSPISVVNHWLSQMPSLSTVILCKVKKCTDLAIESCRNLVKLEIRRMDELKSLNLQNLGSLELFSVIDCWNLLQIRLADLSSLCKMEILDCIQVTKIAGFQGLGALRRMSTNFGNAITIDVADEYSLKNLDSLEAYTWRILKAVDPRSLVKLDLTRVEDDMPSDDQEWLSWWWQNLKVIEEITIGRYRGRSFPPFMQLQNLLSLKKLQLSECRELQVLPELPPSFRREGLIIQNWVDDFGSNTQFHHVEIAPAEH